jgi:hypothetical protein
MMVLQAMEVADLPLVGLTAPALLGLAMLMLLTGRIVPRPTYRDKAEEAERWRAAYETEREARALSNRQTIELLEVTKLTNAIVVAAFGHQGSVWKQGQPDDIPPTT